MRHAWGDHAIYYNKNINHYFMKSSYSQKGFTLVEMLIVIAIIAVLASVALVSVSGVRKSARDTKRVSDISKLQQQLEVYYSQNGSYPATLAAFKTFAEAESNFVDPLNVAYEYAPYSGNNQKYLLRATMEGGTSAAGEPNEIDADNYPTGGPSGIIAAATCDDPAGYCVGN